MLSEHSLLNLYRGEKVIILDYKIAWFFFAEIFCIGDLSEVNWEQNYKFI